MKDNKNIFIEKALKKHGNRYDYSLVVYVDSKTNIIIICSKHGPFTQTPNNHLRSSGCMKCGKEDYKKTKREKYKKDFTKKANIKHNYNYKYPKVNYINATTEIIIECKIHGDFTQTPNNHLLGQGCPECGAINRKENQNKNTSFIEDSKIIHDNFYSYPNVNYVNNKTKVYITCPVHGDFPQIPSSHLNGNGCKKCANRKARLRRISQVEKDKFNGNQMIPSYNPKACDIFDIISEKNNIHILHAMNGGEFHIKEIGYWVDGYDKENNTVYEFDEKHHKYQKEKDLIREKEIIKLLKCKFIRIKE